MKIKTNDTVKIMVGKDKGREGKVEKVFKKTNNVLVSGVNIYKKHVKGAQGQKGGIYEVSRPISVAKVSLVCPNCKKAARVGYKIIGNEKVRICKKCKREVLVNKK